jgi:hypothetical protein
VRGRSITGAGALLVGAALAACSDPVIEMSLQLPTGPGADFDTACVTAVDAYVYGSNYDIDKTDFHYECVPVENRASFGDIKRAIAGKFELPLPSSGLMGVEIEGRTGACDSKNPFGTSDLVFTAGALYHGEDMTLGIKPVASCSTTQLKVKAIDILALTQTKDCATALLPTGTDTIADLGTISPSLVDGPIFWSSFQSAPLVDGVGTAIGLPSVGPESCLAADIGSTTIWSVSCAYSGATVCGIPGELEFGVIDMNAVFTSFDTSNLDRYGGVVIGSVWNTGTPKTPISGATVEVDANHGTVVYVEPSGASLVPTGGTATGPSGMFILYTDTVSTVTITTTRGQRELKLGADPRFPGVALIAM